MCSKKIYLSLVLFLYLTGFVKASCIEYGHSCWGAHGKRSSGGKIYRSLDGSESEQSEGNRDVPSTQDKVKPSELLNILLDRNARMNIDEAKNQHDLSMTNNEIENMFGASEQQQVRRKLKDAFRKGILFHYPPKGSDYSGLKSVIEGSTPRRNQRPSNGNDYYQVENYPPINLDMEYLDLK